jgi:c-di-GMP-related signal transduction protein
MCARVIDRRDDPSAPAKPAAALLAAFTAPPVRKALTGHQGWLNVTRELLFDDGLQRLLPSRVMFEITLDMADDPALLTRLLKLHGLGYRFALDNVTHDDEALGKLVAYVDAVKIDLKRADPESLPKFASELKAGGKLLVALGVDDQADFERARSLGFDRFQGYFFARIHTSERSASAPRHALLNLLQLLASEPTVAQLENELKLNPLLVMHLMRMANSQSFAMGRGEITTLREAINAAGTNRIARWTQLLLYADGRKLPLEDDPLLQLAATRARFLELAINELPDAGRDEQDAAFLAGVFSFIEAVFGDPLESIVDMLTLGGLIGSAIVRREGVLGQLLTLSEAIERADWAAIDEACAGLAPLDAGTVAAFALSAAEWAGMADRNTEATGLERLED